MSKRMNNTHRYLLAAVLIAVSVFVPPQKALGAVSNWSKAVSIYPTSTTDFASDDFDLVLSEIAADNANTVILVIPYYQKNELATVMTPGSDTPTDESITAAIQKAHEHNLAVMLKLHLDTRNGSWRADINPANRNAWFENYEALLLHYAAIGEVDGVEEICLGTELISMAAANVHADNTARWEKIISDVRKVYGGQLTYSANWGPASSNFADEKNHIEFWPSLDFIGLSAYFRLQTPDNSVESLMLAWDKLFESDIFPLYQKYERPIQFTEMGYRSVSNAHLKPYDFQTPGVYDALEQVNAYEAMFRFWDDKPEITGVGIWDFYAHTEAGGVGNTDFTPQHKPAEDTMKKWFTAPIIPVVQIVPTSSKPRFLEKFRNWGNSLQTLFQFSSQAAVYQA